MSIHPTYLTSKPLKTNFKLGNKVLISFRYSSSYLETEISKTRDDISGYSSKLSSREKLFKRYQL